MVDPGEDALMSWLEAFPVRTSASQGAAKESTASKAGSGGKWRGLLTWFDRDSCSWKTAQHSLLEGSESSSVTWPRSGMTVDGRCYLRPISGPRICAKGSGYWPSPTTKGLDGGSNSRAAAKARGMWPTPTTQDNVQVAGQYKNPKSGTTLGGAVRMMPTPKASDGAKGWSPGHNRADTDDRLDYTIEREAHQIGTTGRLNPEFVEWLMGWPIGHTGLEPVETDRLQEWRQQHSPCWPLSSRGDA